MVGAYRESELPQPLAGNPAPTPARSTPARRLCVFTRSGSTWTQRAYLLTQRTDQRPLRAWPGAGARQPRHLAIAAPARSNNATGITAATDFDNSSSNAGRCYLYLGDAVGRQVQHPVCPRNLPECVTSTGAPSNARVTVRHLLRRRWSGPVGFV